MTETILRMENINKSFGDVHVLKNVHFDLKKGEVHALMGENGAGKSTLMKILTGVYTKDSGEVYIDEKKVDYKKPIDAQNDGVAIVHQELNMMNDLTVAENIFIGRESMNGFLIDDNDLNKKALKLIEQLGVKIDPKETVGELTVGKQQMVEIIKSISANARIIVFDEPTAALTDTEIEELFKIIRDLKKKNIAIVYISHRMAEIDQITDRITVMRDGEYVGTVDTKNTTRGQLIKMMVGREVDEKPKEKSMVREGAPVVLEVKNLNYKDKIKDVSFKLRKGEILGFAGLMGAGRTEVARAIFGADPLESGEIYVNGKKVEIKNTEDAVKNSIGYLSEDRRRFGVLTDFSLSSNVSVASIDKFMKNIFIDDKEIEKQSLFYCDQLRIKASSIDQLVRNLSGGNQQKVVIAKWLLRESDILIFDEPTRGIDVGAKSEIYELMNSLIDQGKSIIMISSEMSEILKMSDRILVMCEGRKTAEIPIEQASQEKIMEYATMREGEN
ncbi:MAG: sugar ABC transporter ATP-binding protein [Peptoniphilaceae bacterium]|nr:sugar ABC transporter ATP-binding protein [Peptoniphilaceae bacterium]